MRRTKSIALFGALALALLTATACGAQSATGSGQAADPIKIALVAPMTGLYTTSTNPIELAVSQLNAHGGVNGHRVVYETYDAGISPEQAVAAVKKALSEDPTVMIGLIVTAQVKAVAPILKAQGVPLLHAAQSSEVNLSQTHARYLFRVSQTTYMGTTAIVNYVMQQFKPTTVGIVHSNDNASHQAGMLLKKKYKAAGVRDIVKREVPHTATDLTEAVLAMKGVDVATIWSFPTISSLFLRQMNQHGIDVPTIGSNGDISILTHNLNSSEELGNHFLEVPCYPTLMERPEARQYVADYQEKFGKDEEFNPDDVYLYDAVKLLAAAVEKAHSIKPDAIVESLEDVTYEGVCGTYNSDTEHNMFHSIYIVEATAPPEGQPQIVAEYHHMQATAG